MAKVFWKGSTLLAPVAPTMVSCGSEEKPNIITIAWTGIVNSNPPMTYISVRPSRYSYDIIKESGEFVINLTPSRLVRQADWCGVKSGRDVDKFKECHLTPGKANQVSAPLIEECPINLECKVKNITPLGSHDMFLAEIVRTGFLYAWRIFCSGQESRQLWVQCSQTSKTKTRRQKQKNKEKIIFLKKFEKRC